MTDDLDPARGMIAAVVLGVLAWALIAAALMPNGAIAGPIPDAAKQHERVLTRIVRQEWGLSGDVALHAAQIHQESAWRVGAESPVGAEGLAQFMPATSAWIAELYPDLDTAAPYSASWAMRAMARYNRWHWQRIDAADDCAHRAQALSAYNGGLGWLQRDRALAREAGRDPQRWFCHVEHYTARAGWAEDENRHYVRRILGELAPRYRRAGWSGRARCGGRARSR